MKNEKVVTINGQKYDGVTGLPIGKPSVLPKTSSIKSVHSLAKRSKDFYDRASQKTVNDLRMPIRKIGRSMDIARSKSISHFTPRSGSVQNKPAPTNKLMDIGPIKHPIAAKVEKKRLASLNTPKKPVNNKSSKTIKEEAIVEALNKTAIKPQKISFFKRNKKLINISSVSIVLLIIAASLTYFSMPGIQVSIASAQSGVNASYPEYRPDGYSLDGPVTYTEGEVTIKFHANTGGSSFAITQLKSSWDSSAVKIQADKDSNNGTVETKEGGLTIYTYDNNATWVNGGILYTIKGNAPLSGEQIRHIATSL